MSMGRTKRTGDRRRTRLNSPPPARVGSARETPLTLVKAIGGAFSIELAIDLGSGTDAEIFRWFLAALFFGARITSAIAIRTYREFVKEGLTEPRKIVRRGWDGLVKVLDRGGYVRYDFRTATKLLDVCNALIARYDGSLNRLHGEARDSRDLEERLKALGKGVGDVTAGIFLREMRGIWQKAEPAPSARAVAAARTLGFIPATRADREDALGILRRVWTAAGGKPKRFPDFETALVRSTLRSPKPEAKRWKIAG